MAEQPVNLSTAIYLGVLVPDRTFGWPSGAPSELLRQHHVGTLTRLPVPAQHGGQSKRGEREPNEPGNQMRARLR
jgi:hypothetical protein